MRMKFNKSSQLLLVGAASLLAASLVTACSQLTQTLTVDFVYVASAKAAIVSMIRLTHNNCTAVKTDSSVSLDTAETKVSITAVILTVT